MGDHKHYIGILTDGSTLTMPLYETTPHLTAGAALRDLTQHISDARPDDYIAVDDDGHMVVRDATGTTVAHLYIDDDA